jgi:hypothetical protein
MELNMRVHYAAVIGFSMIAMGAISLATAPKLLAAETVVGGVGDMKQNTAPLASPAVAAACDAAWTAADLNKNGVLDPDEAVVYAAAAKVSQTLETDTNLNRAGFLQACECQTARE